MIWTYRVFCDSQGRYSIREVFYEQDGTIIDCGKAASVAIGSSVEELLQLVQWFKEAFELPILLLEEVEAKIAAQPPKPKFDRSQNISLQQMIAELNLGDENPGDEIN
ncbi:MAG: hypothetical protein HC849_10440 [Oscillatoriales cyanobacterium RU_3_3]|nr:hypothetical protein [Microcoleus sp. SU_5_6]NJL69266.1 hypothetical protein [Microcoleus sp. SM1_3_4]NJM60515.1 hypothetical protein [Oscillatoriales cyanobacterium RU_3_3]NJR22579.1 hypothetical protein [Richelia sp. CSU_2_1]